MFKRLLLFCFLLCGIGCQHTEFTTVQMDKQFSIRIPSYLHPANDILKQASLQYENDQKHVYALVISEEKNNYPDYSITDYYKYLLSQSFIDPIKDAKIQPPVYTKMNGDSAILTNINCKINNTPIYYKLAIISSKKYFYQILGWTRTDEKDKYEADLKTMIHSFHELSTAKSEQQD